MSNFKVLTCAVPLSYPHLFAPQPPMEPGGKEKFGVVLVFDEAAQATDEFAEMKQTLLDCVYDKYGKDKGSQMLKSNKLKTPFRTDRNGYAEGTVTVGVSSIDRPGIVSIYPDANGKPSSLTDESKVYPGVIGRASIRAYCYDVGVNKGVTFGLNNVQILRDGVRLDGRVQAKDEFEADMSAVAPLEDLTDEGGEGVVSDMSVDLLDIMNS